MRSQFVTTKFSKTRTTPYAFTEHGVAMLSSVLKSKYIFTNQINYSNIHYSNLYYYKEIR
ncbi:ORF6N domain-containing protein [Arcobacter arenosus]|uniref:ORF6N domain-containing protein n=1 Tax=Arcobacter arenosus TaxID=2576037 RepID=A0A5R8XXF9_9BACT|nr:ORF6N domain-containing protein [Arcobacter arenosus]